MNDLELDELLRASADAPPVAAGTTAVQLAQEIRDEVAGAVPLRRRRVRRGLVVAGALGVVVTLTGAGTLAAYQLSVPPFSTTQPGESRTTTPIPVNYTNSLGRRVECLAFIDYRNLSADQQAALEKVPTEDRWRGYGDRLMKRLDMPSAGPYAQNEAVGAAVNEDLYRAAREAVPGMTYMGDTGGPDFSGSALSCAGPGGAEGRP